MRKTLQAQRMECQKNWNNTKKFASSTLMWWIKIFVCVCISMWNKIFLWSILDSQNCELPPSWSPRLSPRIASIEPIKVSESRRNTTILHPSNALKISKKKILTHVNPGSINVVIITIAFKQLEQIHKSTFEESFLFRTSVSDFSEYYISSYNHTTMFCFASVRMWRLSSMCFWFFEWRQILADNFTVWKRLKSGFIPIVLLKACPDRVDCVCSLKSIQYESKSSKKRMKDIPQRDLFRQVCAISWPRGDLDQH